MVSATMTKITLAARASNAIVCSSLDEFKHRVRKRVRLLAMHEVPYALQRHQLKARDEDMACSSLSGLGWVWTAPLHHEMNGKWEEHS
jgi:hypothetical protein